MKILIIRCRFNTILRQLKYCLHEYIYQIEPIETKILTSAICVKRIYYLQIEIAISTMFILFVYLFIYLFIYLLLFFFCFLGLWFENDLIKNSTCVAGALCVIFPAQFFSSHETVQARSAALGEHFAEVWEIFLS